VTTVEFDETEQPHPEPEEIPLPSISVTPDISVQQSDVDISRYNIPHKYMNSNSKRILEKSVTKLDEHVITRSATYSLITCPHCNRKFAPRSAENHIPICAQVKNRPTNRLFDNQQSKIPRPQFAT
jgi:hypothetical protein